MFENLLGKNTNTLEKEVRGAILLNSSILISAMKKMGLTAKEIGENLATDKETAKFLIEITLGKVFRDMSEETNPERKAMLLEIYGTTKSLVEELEK